jgi:hypothetical protein
MKPQADKGVTVASERCPETPLISTAKMTPTMAACGVLLGQISGSAGLMVADDAISLLPASWVKAAHEKVQRSTTVTVVWSG